MKLFRLALTETLWSAMADPFAVHLWTAEGSHAEAGHLASSHFQSSNKCPHDMKCFPDRHHDTRLPLTCTVHGTHPEVMQRPALRQDRQRLIHVAHRRPSEVLIIAHKERRELGPPVQSQSQIGAQILSRAYGCSASSLSFRALTRGPLIQISYNASALACSCLLGHFDSST